MKDLTASTIGNHVIVDILGKGGMATVYRAKQESMGREVAIKIVPTTAGQESEMLSQRFEREVRLIAQLQHPQILPVYDYGQTPDFTYLVMRLVETGTLADRLKNEALDLSQAAHILNQLATALDYAHQNDVVHRDLKPANVFLDAQNNVYLADFGIAKLLGQVGTQLTSTGYVLGTPAYMSPEQAIDQPIDKRADVYALGLILFEMLTGQQVFSGGSPISIILKHVNEPPPLPSSLATHLTPEIDTVVSKALAKSPDDRYQSAGELAAAFSAVLQPATAFQPFGALESLTPLPTSTTPSTFPSALPANATENAAQTATQTTGLSAAPSTPKKSTTWWWVGGGALVGGGLLAITVVALVIFLAFGNGWFKTEAKDLEQTPSTAVVAAFTPTPTITLAEPTKTVAFTATSTVVIAAPTEAPTVTLTVSPTATTPPTATSTAVSPTPTPTSTSVPEPSAQRVGTVRFSSTQTRLDTINIQLSDTEIAPAGKHYEGWLIGDTGASLNVGLLVPDGNGNVDFAYIDDQRRNLAAIYTTFRVSLEPDFGDAPEISREVVFEGAVNSAALPFIREAILRAVDTPLHSLLDGLETEAALGLDHLNFARGGLAGDNFAGGLSHAEHVINIITGSSDERFGDKNGDGQAQNPGDGYGVLGYLQALQAAAIAAGQADPASTELALHVAYLQATIQNSIQRSAGIVQLLERSFAQDSAASALALVDQAIALYGELVSGFDANSNGVVEPIQGEGGISLVTQHTGYLSNIEVYRVQEP